MPAEFFSTDSTEHGGAMRPFFGKKLSVGVTCDEVWDENHCVIRAALLSLSGNVPTLLATHENTSSQVPEDISSVIMSAVKYICGYFGGADRVNIHLALDDQYLEHRIFIGPPDLSGRELAGIAKREMHSSVGTTIAAFDISRAGTFQDESDREMARHLLVFAKTGGPDHEMSEIEEFILNHGYRLRSSASAFVGLLRAFPILVSQGAEIVVLINTNQCAVAILDEKRTLENMRVFPIHQKSFAQNQATNFPAMNVAREIGITIAYLNQRKQHGRQACVVVGNNPIVNPTICVLRENYGDDFVRPFKIDTEKLNVRSANVASNLQPFIPAIGLALPQTKGMPRINLLQKGLRGNTWLQRLLHA